MAKSSELQLFEAIESMTLNDSFCSKSSMVQKFLKQKFDLNNTQQSIPEEILDDLSYSDSDTSYNSIHPPTKSDTEDIETSIHFEEHDDTVDDLEEVGDDVELELERKGKGHLSVDLVDASMDETRGIEMWTEYFRLKEAKQSLELEQMKLAKQQEFFKTRHAIEEDRLKADRKRVEAQRKQLQGLIADYHKIQFSKEEYEAKVNELTEQLKEAKLQMNKRISSFGNKQKKLEERVKILEKENEDLKRDKKTVTERLATLKRPPMRCITENQNSDNKKQSRFKRRVQFADNLAGGSSNPDDDRKENAEKMKSITPNAPNDSTTSTSSINNETLAGSSSELNAVNSVETLHSSSQSAEKEVNLSDDEADKTMPSDYFELTHPCGTKTRVTKDGKFIRHVLVNKDEMDELDDCSIRYYYHELGFSQTTYPNGDEIIEYNSGEIEMTRADGSKVYTYKDGLVRMVDAVAGSEEVIFGDGMSVQKTIDAESTINWPNGQKEVRTAEYVKRVYPNGNVKILYADGSQETRYFNGRVRRKDKNGVLVEDTKKNKRKIRGSLSKTEKNETI